MTRRRVIAALAATALVAGLAFLATEVLGGDDGDEAASEVDDPAAVAEPEVVAQVILRPVGAAEGAGGAIVVTEAGQPVMLLQGRAPSAAGRRAVVQLFNDPNDALPVATGQVDRRGNVQSLAPLPPDFERYRFVDVALAGGGESGGRSLLRGPLGGALAPGGGAP